MKREEGKEVEMENRVTYCSVCRITFVRRAAVLAIVKTMAFVSWKTTDTRRVSVSASGSDVDATLHRFVLIGAATAVRPIRSTSVCKYKMVAVQFTLVSPL